MQLVAESSNNRYCSSAQVAVGLEDYLAFDARFSLVGVSLAGYSQKQELQDQMQTLKS